MTTIIAIFGPLLGQFVPWIAAAIAAFLGLLLYRKKVKSEGVAEERKRQEDANAVIEKEADETAKRNQTLSDDELDRKLLDPGGLPEQPGDDPGHL